MAHVGVHRLATGDGQKCGADNGKADVEVLVDQEIEGIERAEGDEHAGRHDDAVDAERGEHGEPADHDRAECPPDKLGALPLYEEQPDQDHDRERHDGRRKRRRVGLQAFDGAEHRDGRRNRAVTIEQGGADEADHQQFRAPCSGLRMARVEQRQQRDDAAFAAVVRAQDQKRVFDRDDQDQRPQDQRHHAEDGFICQRPAMGGGLGRFLQGVEGAGADVAVDDTKGAERGGCGELSGMAGGCNWRDWSLAPPLASRPPDQPRGAINCQSATRRRKLPWGSDCPESFATATSPPESMRSSGGIPRTSNQSNLAANNERKGRVGAPTGCGRR